MQGSQQGRSMLEMIAVLAIAATLSTTGLAGYVMAMNRYRANMILDYVNRCALLSRVYQEGYVQEEIYCGDLLTDPAPCGLEGRQFVVKDTNNADTTTTFGASQSTSEPHPSLFLPKTTFSKFIF